MRSYKSMRMLVVALIGVLLLAGCNSGMFGSSVSRPASAGSTGDTSAPVFMPTVVAAGIIATPLAAERATLGPVSALPVAMNTEVGSIPATFAPLPTTVAATLPTANNVPTIKAGDIDDNRLWNEYLSYRGKASGVRETVHDVDISERHTITVTDSEGVALLGARVRIYLPNSDSLIHESYTYANGQTLFFPRAAKSIDKSVEVIVDKGNLQKKFVLTRAEKSEWRVTLDMETPKAPRTQLDVVFLLDTTSSMGDELEQLQANILSVSRQIDALPGQPDVRYGLVAFKDRGDEYITRIDPFTSDVKTFQSRLNALRATGGGDIPESLNAGLHDAIHGVEWRGDNTIKLIFLVADAPPHLDYGDDFDYAVEMRQAAKKGIKIHALAASGLTSQGEYIFRQLAQYTLGHFIFITYQQPASAQGQNPVDSRPGEDTNLNISKDSYQTELLDQLVVRLVRQEIAALTSRP